MASITVLVHLLDSNGIFEDEMTLYLLPGAVTASWDVALRIFAITLSDIYPSKPMNMLLPMCSLLLGVLLSGNQ